MLEVVGVAFIALKFADVTERAPQQCLITTSDVDHVVGDRTLRSRFSRRSVSAMVSASAPPQRLQAIPSPRYG